MKGLLTLLLLLSFNSYAEKENKKEERFNKAKARVIEHFDKKIKMFQDAKSCANSASDRSALKECLRNLKNTRKQWKKQRKERRQQRKKN